jgi:ELWxxDGT repeat protein
MSRSIRLSGCFLLAAVTGFLAVPAFAAGEEPGPAQLAADLAPGTVPFHPSISDFARIGSRVVFLGADNEHFPALWVTDGTSRGTRPLAVLCPPCSGAELLGSTGSVAFYRVGQSSPDFLARIWRTDGTPEGTFPVTRGIMVPHVPGVGFLRAIAGGRLFFAGCTAELGCELWSSDGSLAGTAPVGEIVPGPEESRIFELVAAGEQVFLIAGPSDDRRALWVAEASGRAPRRLRETPKARMLIAGSAGGGRVFFIAQDLGLEVWTSDGTRVGTRPLTSFGPREPFGEYPRLLSIAGRVYFQADGGVHGSELWSLGARESSLRRLTDFSSPSAFVSTLARAGERIVFEAGLMLWTSRGDFRSTAPLTGCPGGCPFAKSSLVDAGQGRLVFYGRDRTGDGFWVTDGTGPGTRLLKRLDRERWYVQAVPSGGRVLFEVTEEYETGELWVTDGTPAGTFFAAYGGPRWSHYYGWADFLEVDTANDRLVFPALGQTAEGSHESLWSSDGSPAGLRRLTRAMAGKSSGPRWLVPFRDGLLVQDCNGTEGELRFVSTTGTTTSATRLLGMPVESCDAFAAVPVDLGATAVLSVFGKNEVSLWHTDGTPEGTSVLVTATAMDQPQGFTRFGGQVAFWRPVPAANNELQTQLWATDGTPAGTRKLVDLPPGVNPYDLTGVGDRLYFFDAEQQDGQFAARPWVSDGTPAGTRPLTAVNGLRPAGQPFGSPAFLGFGGRVFFPLTQGDGPVEIWSTDGTPAGTGPAVAAAAGMTRLESLQAIGGRLYFAAVREHDPAGRLLPWVSDGTTAGTAPLIPAAAAGEIDLGLSGAYDFAPEDLLRFVEVNGRVFFAASDPVHGDELWATDGTSEGTARVRDVIPGERGSYPRGLVAWNGRLWFRALDAVHGMELWTSDGSAEGTRLVQDIAAGASWSTPRELAATGRALYFSAYESVHGRELWVLPEVALDSEP